MIKEDSLISDIKEHFNTLLNARSLAISNDERVLEFLLAKSRFKNEYKERFFQAQYGALIFKKDEFLNFLDLRLLSHSYTSFSNKIGLGTSEKKFLKNSQNKSSVFGSFAIHMYSNPLSIKYLFCLVEKHLYALNCFLSIEQHSFRFF